MKVLIWNRLKETLHRFDRDQSGLALIYVTVALPVIIGMSLLAIDVGRLWSLQSSLQHGADALALAGAGELDRRTDAITRAERAIDTLITTNKDLFATSIVTITGTTSIGGSKIVSKCYMEALPTSDATQIVISNAASPATNCRDNASADPEKVRYIKVIVSPQDFNTIFPATFLGVSSNSAQASANAVAGFDAAVCNFTPLFICNPFEPVGNTDVMRSTELFDHISSIANKRRLIQMKRHDNGQWSPGNYGYLESPLGPGANALRDMIATANPKACFIQNGVYTKPGNVASANAAWNVRFDMYSGSMNSAKNDPQFRPARNVRRGFIPATGNGNGVACNATAAVEPNGNYEKLTRDNCFTTNTCPIGNDRIGDGIWDFDKYWLENFQTTTKPNDKYGVAYSNLNRPTRYDIYRYENGYNLITGLPESGHDLIAHRSGNPILPTTGERGTPTCYDSGGAASTTPVSDTPDRRVFYSAIMNCIAQPIANGSSGGPYRAVAFGKFFMTEPMGGAQDSLWSELVDIVEPGSSNSVARDMVQLYR